MKIRHIIIPGMQQKQFYEGIYSNTGLLQETRKYTNKNLTLHLKEVGKEQTPSLAGLGQWLEHRPVDQRVNV